MAAHAIALHAGAKSAVDFERTWKECLDIPDLKNRLAALKGAILSLSPDAYPAAWEMTRGLPYAFRCDIAPVILEAWAAHDPEAAYTKLASLPVGELHDRGYAATIAGHVARSPSAAMEKALNEIDDHSRSVALQALGSALASHPEAAAHAQALTNLRGLDEGMALGSFLDERGQRNPSKAFDELSAALLVEGHSMSPDVVEATFAKAAFAEPEKAFAVALQTPAETNRNLALVITYSYWLETDPAKALASLSSLPAVDRSLLADTIGGTLGHTSNPAINAWIETQPEENVRVDAAKAYALALSQRDRKKALQWVHTLPVGLVRSEAEFTLLSSTTSARAVTTDDSLLQD